MGDSRAKCATLPQPTPLANIVQGLARALATLERFLPIRLADLCNQYCCAMAPRSELVEEIRSDGQ
jgi:hypothetical protein